MKRIFVNPPTPHPPPFLWWINIVVISYQQIPFPDYRLTWFGWQNMGYLMCGQIRYMWFSLSFFNFQPDVSAFEQVWKEWLNIVEVVSSACFQPNIIRPSLLWLLTRGGLPGNWAFYSPSLITLPSQPRIKVLNKIKKITKKDFKKREKIEGVCWATELFILPLWSRFHHSQ